MTTDTTFTSRLAGIRGAGPLARVLVLAGGGATALSALVVILAAIVGGAPAASGAVVGAMLALLVFLTGTVVIHLVAQLVPAMALLVALMTFTLQVLVVALVFWKLSQSGLLEDGTLTPGWVAASLIVATVVWSVGQIRAVTHARIPAFDLPQEKGEGDVG